MTNPGTPEYERSLQQRLLERMEGQLAEDEQQALNEELIQSPETRKQLLRSCALEFELRRWGQTMLVTQEQSQLSTCQPSSLRRYGLWIGAVAACLLIGFILSLGQWGSQPLDKPLAHLEYSSKIQWTEKFKPNVGDPLRHGLYHLQQGQIRVRMEDGTRVTVEGPARFELVDKDLLKLTEGTVSAKITQKTSRFTVRTETVDVVDMGTAFGVNIGENGLSTISVFEGAVAVKQISGSDLDDPLMLKAGTSVQTDLQTQMFSPVPYDPQLFESLWPLTNGIDEMAGLVQFVPPGPISSLDTYRSDETIFMIPEQQHTLVPSAIYADMVDPGHYDQFSLDQGPELIAGQTVDSYLLFFNNTPSEREKAGKYWPVRYQRLQGTITFARPIIGVIATHKKLTDSDGVFGLPEIAYGGEFGRGLEPVTYDHREKGVDTIEISHDRRKLRFELLVAARYIDQFRVLVASPSPVE